VQGCKANGALLFACLQPGQSGLGDAHLGGELSAGHPEGIADGAYPAAMGPRLVEQGSEPSEPSVQLSSGVRRRGLHQNNTIG
jgi:hypothetical protein